MNLSERIADWLVQQGITQVFAVTGGGAMYLNQALGAHPGLQCTYLHHEQACAMAAEGYARIAGKPAVVMVTTDKVYRNNEWHWPYREDDVLGGHDPYSASKAASEVVLPIILWKSCCCDKELN